jgi:hypothetical protein
MTLTASFFRLGYRTFPHPKSASCTDTYRLYMSLCRLGHGETGLMQPGSRDRSVGKVSRVRWRVGFRQAGAEKKKPKRKEGARCKVQGARASTGEGGRV